MKHNFEFLHLKGWAIHEQLELEEGLLRADDRNFFLIGEGSRHPSIVMGISGKAEQLVDFSKKPSESIALIRRFSGGGTVIVDEETLFVTFIGNRELLDVQGPESILRWAEALLRPAFGNHPFRLRENDFVLGEKKCGGNALYLQKHRFLVHTSLLWDYKEDRMDLLLHPPKTPDYRQGRSHIDFVCRLKDHLPSKSELIQRLRQQIEQTFCLHAATPSSLFAKLEISDYRRSIAKHPILWNST